MRLTRQMCARRRRTGIISMYGIPTSATRVASLHEADLPVPENSICSIIKTRSKEVTPAVMRIDFKIDANDKSDSRCSGKRSGQEVRDEAAVGWKRHFPWIALGPRTGKSRVSDISRASTVMMTARICVFVCGISVLWTEWDIQ